ncbi:MAG: hypothetical protein R2699_07325 [Acidimicrobiales bacterium]|nr:hypothetical protein [Acidimicrobiales bacterium]
MTIHRLHQTVSSATVDVATGDWGDVSNLLRHVMGDERFTQRYLTWLYDECPDGDTVAVDIGDERPDIVGHGAAVPVMLRNAERRERFVQIVNIAVAERGRGNNVFATQVLAHIPYVLEQGAIGGFGVTNEASTVPGTSLDGLGASFLMQLPLKVCPPMGTGLGVVSYDCSPSFLASRAFARIAATVDHQPAGDWLRCWTTDALRWRLNRPDTHYVLHVADEAVAVSTKSFVKGVPVAVIVKLLPRGTSPGPISGRSLVAAACRYHKAPSVFYAGYNAQVQLRGVSVPRERVPAPLNLLFLTLSDLDQQAFRFDTFELLDFDAI